MNKALIGILLAGTAGIIIFLFVHLSSGTTPRLGTQSAAAACTKGKDCLPDVNYVDTNGVAYTPKSLAGKVVVINFFATWCGPCLKELPDLSRISERYKDQGVVFLGVLTSDDRVDNAALLNFQSDHDLRYPVIRATSDILVSFQYPGNLPTTFIYDRNGRQVYAHIGSLHADTLTEVLEPLL